MVIGGFYLGIAHDTYERFAYLWRNKRLFAYLFATIFWLSQAAIIFMLLYRANYGELRVYIFLACLLGFSIYQLLAANLYRKLLNGILTLLRKLFTFLFTIFKVVIIYPLQLLIRILVMLLKVLSNIILSIINLLLLPFKIVAKLLYQLLPERIKKYFDKNSSFYSIIEFIYSKLRSIMSFIRR